MAKYNAIVVRILATVALVLTALAAIGWLVFIGGLFRNINIDPTTSYTGGLWDPHWVVFVLSPVLFILMIVKSIMMIIRDGLFRKFFITHILAVIAFIITVIVLCFTGFILGIRRFAIEASFSTDYQNAMFTGALLEVLFLGGAWICHILAHFFGGVPEESSKL